MLLDINGASVSRGGVKVLTDFSFSIRGTEKIAIVGRNGAGKSTLLSVIDRTCPVDGTDGHPERDVRFSRAVTIGTFSQLQTPDDEEKTPGDFVREAADVLHIPEESPLFSDFVRNFLINFTRLGFDKGDRTKKLCEFSGGERTKILLLRLFLMQPDILLLDEPTNHLDLETVEWLEDQVRACPKAVVFVSHDRYFIDRTAEVVFEVSGGKLTKYAGAYTQYREEKAKRFGRLTRQYQAQQEEIRRLEDLITRFRGKPRKAAFARSRARLLEKMDRLPKPDPDDAHICTGEIVPLHMGAKNVLDCEKLKIGYSRDKVLRTVSFRLRRGQKIGIFGPNGSGKSTFLKTLAGRLAPLSGRLSVSDSAEIAYFDQMSAEATFFDPGQEVPGEPGLGEKNSEKRVFNYFHDLFPALTGKEVRQILAGYLFGEQDLGKEVSALSGGERARLVLAVLLQRRPNVLLLDEPTNNMDIPAKETLESIFRMYKGTLVFISHDRYFLSHVAEELLWFPAGEDKVYYYPYGYEHYREKQKEKKGGDPDAMRTAEEQRMIEDLRSVPKGSSMGLRDLSTAALQIDWEFDQNRALRKPAEEAFAKAAEEYALAAASGFADAFGTLPEDGGIPDPEDSGTAPPDGACRAAADDPKNEEWLRAYMNSSRESQREAALREKMETARAVWTKELVEWYGIWLEQNPEQT